MRTQTVEAQVIRLVEMEMDVSDVTRESRLVDDLGCDSLDTVELIMAIEETFDLEIRDEDAETLQTVGAMVDYVERRLAE